jgi:hypothetical protein
MEAMSVLDLSVDRNGKMKSRLVKIRYVTR